MFKDGSNYFKDSFTFTKTDSRQFTYGFSKIELNNKSLEGEFFVDSFTYTPFVDYSQTEYDEAKRYDARVGVYSDTFLNDYNTGAYDSDNPPISQFDEHRRKLSGSLYSLRNLEKDLYDAKMAFRKSIEEETDSKVYIHTFCTHLATLFAKLSNIRMCHEFYGFKAPHHEWEGILALDIWYQMLYKAIDAAYPFNDSYLNMNPMLRKKVCTDDGGRYVELETGGKVH